MGGRTRKVAAVVFSILVLTATAAGPAVGSLQTQTQTETADSVTSIDQDLTPFEKKQRALKLSQNLNPAPGKQEAAAKRARRHLRNSSWRLAYRDSVRVKNKSTVETDAKAVRALGKFEGTSSETTAHRSSKLVVAADDESAEQAIEDAWRAYDARKDTMSKGERRSAKAHIENAERALERAREAQERAEYAENSSQNSLTIAGFSIDSILASDSLQQAQKGKKGKDKGEKKGEEKGNNGKSGEKGNSDEKNKEKGNNGKKDKEKDNNGKSGENGENKGKSGTNGENEDKENNGNNGEKKGENGEGGNGEKDGKNKKGKDKDGKKKGKDKSDEKNGKQKGKDKGKNDGKKGDNGKKKGKTGRDTKTNATASPPKKARGKNAFKERAKALVHLKTAVKQANLALTRIDGASEPEVTIESEIDPVWQDGQPNRYYLTGNYTDVVIGDPEPVTVTVGNRSVTTNVVSASNSPMANQTFRVEVERPERISAIEVRAPDGENELNGTESLLLDGDGLPERIERDVGSDPLDSDSDVGELDGDQSGDGVHDGAAVARSDRLGSIVENGTFLKPTPIVLGNDTDADGISDRREQSIGLNASNNDTDGDGISDRYETNGGAHVDSDDDGTLDVFDDDSEGDGVVDARERRDDTDTDLLANYRDRDDDGDGIATATEVDNGSTYLHDVDFDDVVNWRDTDSDDDGIPDGEEGLVDHDDDGMPAYFDNDRDNDGLPDFYERNVTGTDPSNNDSDSSQTARDEGGNEVIDGMEDFDGDTLGAYLEYKHGTDPFAADSDDDGLTDGFEVRQPALDPLDATSNDDGVLDGDADFDNDTLSNQREVEVGTSITRADTERDGLRDDRELSNGTDPLLGDTDDDGLIDSEELSLPTDPLDPDTDDDGVLDGNETFTTTTRNESVGATVDTTGVGDTSADVTVENDTNDRLRNDLVDPARASEFVSFQSQSSFDTASVTLQYNDSALPTNESDLAIYRVNETAQRYERLDSTVDSRENTVSATTTKTGTVTVMSPSTLDAQFSPEDAPENATVEKDSFEERTNCTGDCGTDDGSLTVGPLDSSSTDSSASQNTLESRSLSADERLRSQSLSDKSETPELTGAEENETVKLVGFKNGSQKLTVGNDSRWYDRSDEYPRKGFSTQSEEEPEPYAIINVPSDGTSVDIDATVSADAPGDTSASFTADGNTIFSISGGSVDDKPVSERLNVDGGDTVELYLRSESTIEKTAYINLDSWSYDIETEDDDGGGGGQKKDFCKAVDGRQSIECPDSAVGVYSIPIDRDVESVTVQGVGTGAVVGDNSEAKFHVTGVESKTLATVTSNGSFAVNEKLTDLEPTSDSNRLTIRISTTGLAGMRLDGLVIRKDTDGDGLADSLERGFRTGLGERIRTGINDTDTDDDGLSDAEEVGEFVEAEADGSYLDTYVKIDSDPTAVDSDGDGLADETEVNGWNADLATEPGQAKEYRDALQADDPNADDLLSHPDVSSDPLKTDTNGDGISDTTEHSLGTDPRSSDSDDDGASDYEEYTGTNDPTLHDYSAPTVSVRSIDTADVARTAYEVTLRVRDQSGIKRVGLYKKGDEQYSLLGHGREEIGFRTVNFTVDRSGVEKIVTGTASFFTATSVTVETTDVHGTTNRHNASGADTFGRAAEIVANSPVLPPDVGKTEIILLMSFASGVTANIGKTILGIADMVTHAEKYIEQMYQMAAYILDNLEVLAKLPGMMVDQVSELREQRNPFQDQEDRLLGDPHEAWNLGWSVGYLAGTAVQIAVGSGLAAAVKRSIKTSSRLAPVVGALGSLKHGTKVAVSAKALTAAGKVRKALPEVDVNQRKLLKQLDETSAPARARTVRQMDKLSSRTKSYLDETSVADPGTKTAKLIRHTGKTGRKALDALATGNRKAANALLRAADDVVTHRAMLRAWENGDIDTEELAKGLRRYDELNANEKAFLRESLRRADDETIHLVNIDICNSPCDSPIDTAFELAEARDGLDNSHAKKLLHATRAGEDVDAGPGANRKQALETINELGEEDNLNGLDRAIRDIAGTETGYKQLTGETDIADGLLDGDNGVGAKDIVIQQNIPEGKVPNNAPLQSTEVDVDVNRKITVNGETFDSPAVESKHYNPDSRTFGQMVDSDLRELRKKLTTQAASGEDEIIVVMTGEYIDTFEDRLNEIPRAVQNHPSVNSDVRIKFVSYREFRNSQGADLKSVSPISGYERAITG